MLIHNHMYDFYIFLFIVMVFASVIIVLFIVPGIIGLIDAIKSIIALDKRMRGIH